MNIYKYSIEPFSTIEINCKGVISAIEQHGTLIVYVIVGVGDERNYPHQIKCVGTGQLDNKLDDTWLHVDTVKVGLYVWHVFYKF